MQLWVELVIATDDDWERFTDYQTMSDALVFDAKGRAWHVYWTDDYEEALYATRPPAEDESDESINGFVEAGVIPLPAVAIIKPDRRLLRIRDGKIKLKEQSEAATGNRTEAPGEAESKVRAFLSGRRA